MAYRYDNDLEFLKTCSADELDILVTLLTRDKDGKARFNESLTKSPKYKLNAPQHNLYWDVIAEEIQRFGANSIVTLFRRGKGVTYREILIDVCKKMKVNFNYDVCKNIKVNFNSSNGVVASKEPSCKMIEQNLLLKILTDSMDKMSPAELQEITKELNLKTTNFTKEAIVIALQASIRIGGFAAYQVALIVANSVARMLVGRGLALAANAGLTRAMGVFAGPVGWALTGAWTIADLSGPAFRITIPCVIQIACLRAQKKQNESSTADFIY